MLTSAECRDARELLGWSRDRLAGRCGVSASSIMAYERAEKPLLPRDWGAEVPRMLRIRAALEQAGIEFLDEIEGRIAVRLR